MFLSSKILKNVFTPACASPKIPDMIKPKAFQRILFDKPYPFDLYLPEERGPFPLVCITPLLGRLILFEDLCLERWFARFFAKHGMAAAVMARPIFEFDPGHGLEQLREHLEQSVDRNREILNVVTAQETINPQRIGSLGISFGAVVNALWAGRDPRLKAHVLALGGDRLADIFVTSRDPLMRSYFEAALRNQRCGVNELKSRLEKIFSADSLTITGVLPREKILMVLALFDRVIRFQYGWSLRQALGNPETVFLPFGHYTAILSAPFLRWKMLRFFKEKL